MCFWHATCVSLYSRQVNIIHCQTAVVPAWRSSRVRFHFLLHKRWLVLPLPLFTPILFQILPPSRCPRFARHASLSIYLQGSRGAHHIPSEPRPRRDFSSLPTYDHAVDPDSPRGFSASAPEMILSIILTCLTAET